MSDSSDSINLDPQAQADIDALNEHQAMIDGPESPHRAAFNMPPQHRYSAGDIVWMADCNVTGKVLGPAINPWTNVASIVLYQVSAVDVNGELHVYEYEYSNLRPADKEYTFIWPSLRGK